MFHVYFIFCVCILCRECFYYSHTQIIQNYTWFIKHPVVEVFTMKVALPLALLITKAFATMKMMSCLRA